VKQLLTRALRDVADGLLGNAILEVSVYTTDGELLVLLVACLFERVVGESTIVAVIMLNPYAVLGSKGLEGAFGNNGFDG
jgi:hypothetical protein